MKVTSESRCISPEQAVEYLTCNQFPNQRDVNSYKLKEYVSSMRLGEWIAGSTISFGSVEEVGIRYLLNGQHRLTAVFESGTSQEFNVKEYTWTKDEPYMDTMKSIYATEDTGAKRTKLNMIAAYELDADLGISKTLLSRALASVTLLDNGFAPRRELGPLPVQEQIRLLREWQEPIKMAATILPNRGSAASKFTVSPVLSVMLATLKHQPEMAVPFWMSICENNGLIKGTAAWALRKYIEDTSVYSADKNIYTRKVAHGWNAFYEGRAAGYFLIKDPSLPVRILGTPYR